MNKEIKQRWIKALRSGSYQQGKTFLRQMTPNQSDKFCCLGVLCDLYLKDHPDSSEWETIVEYTTDKKSRTSFNVGGYAISAAYPPKPVLDWAEFGFPKGSDSIIVNHNGSRWNIAAVNDEIGLSFNEIAHIIETQL